MKKKSESIKIFQTKNIQIIDKKQSLKVKGGGGYGVIVMVQAG